MSKSAEQLPNLSAEDTYAWIRDKIFPLRPSEYKSQYPNWPGLVGIEVEMLPVRSQTIHSNRPDMIPLYKGDESVVAMLRSMSSAEPAWTYNAVPAGSEHLMNVFLDDQDQLSFEPGGQLEFSSRPYPCLSEALQRMETIQTKIDKAAAARGITLLQLGMNPWKSVSEIGLQMEKPRYRAMDQFFAAQGPHGQRMMRQTCTIQINLDFGATEEILAKRYLLGNLMAPMATATFAHSPFLDGQPTALRSNRGDTWQHMDASRTGFPNLSNIISSLSRKACVDAYVDWIMAGRVVFQERLGYQVMDGKFTFADWLNQIENGPTLQDLQTHLSLQFPEVRARGFLELRSIDCQHRYWQAVPAAYCTGLLYDDTSLNQALDLLLPYYPKLDALWRKAPLGLQDPELRQLSQKVYELALEGFARTPACYQGEQAQKLFHDFYKHYTSRGLTPADELLQIHARKGQLTPADIIALPESWT